MIPPKNDIPDAMTKEKPSQMVGGAKLHLESDFIPTRDAKMAQANLVCTRIQRPHRN